MGGKRRGGFLKTVSRGMLSRHRTSFGQARRSESFHERLEALSYQSGSKIVSGPHLGKTTKCKR